jgi:hypothetical protein
VLGGSSPPARAHHRAVVKLAKAPRSDRGDFVGSTPTCPTIFGAVAEQQMRHAVNVLTRAVYEGASPSSATNYFRRASGWTRKPPAKRSPESVTGSSPVLSTILHQFRHRRTTMASSRDEKQGPSTRPIKETRPAMSEGPRDLGPRTERSEPRRASEQSGCRGPRRFYIGLPTEARAETGQPAFAALPLRRATFA